MMIQFLKDETGQDMVEYSLLLVLIGAAGVFILSSLGITITNIFNNLNVKLQGADEKIS